MLESEIVNPADNTDMPVGAFRVLVNCKGRSKCRSPDSAPHGLVTLLMALPIA